ncbi:Hypothetical protein Deide_3p00555 (plasmid) [Deinococcus deserti VCD115]|uniref:Uncharacterized protein n=1 Tax=Deinococcus deserti (strain DSM 17065 / CIP 109153 / LMG 22923 / VCD115) TaxID=546414 RepID=C1D4A1_DEIDV|nr:Hypothetical protein Deide_3p00555 [Deinococcus deserti VCD115]
MKRLLTTVILLAVTASAQEGPAVSSSLLRVPLSTGAVRVADAAAAREFGQVLNGLARNQNSGCQTSEFLVWDDVDRAEEISTHLATQFNTAARLTVVDEIHPEGPVSVRATSLPPSFQQVARQAVENAVYRVLGTEADGPCLACFQRTDRAKSQCWSTRVRKVVHPTLIHAWPARTPGGAAARSGWQSPRRGRVGKPRRLPLPGPPPGWRTARSGSEPRNTGRPYLLWAAG